MKKHLSFVLRLAVSLGLLYYLFNKVPYPDLKNIYLSAQIPYIISGVMLFYISIFLGQLRWYYILKKLSINVKFKEVFIRYFSALFFNLFFPSIVAGDIFRGAGLTSRHGETKKIISSVLVDRVNGAFALGLVAFIFSIFGREILLDNRVFYSVLALCILIFGGTVFLFSKHVFKISTFFISKKSQIYKKLLGMHETLYFFRVNPLVFAKSLLCFSLPIQLLAPCAFYLFAKGFGVQASFVSIAIIVPICMAIALIPIAIAGLGIRESAVVYFFTFINIPPDISMGMSLLNGFALIFIGILGGLFYVTLYHRCLQCDT
ncbi:MAG: lysylphosphatidylglycerol synthase transmembrane domain-containing protein [Candidatus Omnitrophica bacterium]|nr:lysylphosphatidylglycerol synthase transmembrane domain-containing protein [Candidatus Omnitrophota bacterium]MDD5080554.1 lysylphosphatidylglycerol synthase transmembrane domain-containing protein [Candidatus Omnitrophota bacterium]MDD5441284.1 lysylphosphatidylglycerol synthase transmembrane domain-containing protein [Candidatus Omnitrophota bacterium]